VAVYVEQSLAKQSDIICAAGTHTDTVRLAYEDFARLVEPTVAAFAQEDPTSVPAHLREAGRNQED
jgi:prolyl-tRNA editing enzyme YbaK/EbsC (Cys-tRNA(Pro) deacylase)